MRFLKIALTGEKVDAEFETMQVKGFVRMPPPTQRVPILVAALREGMLRLGTEGMQSLTRYQQMM